MFPVMDREPDKLLPPSVTGAEAPGVKRHAGSLADAISMSENFDDLSSAVLDAMEGDDLFPKLVLITKPLELD